MSVALFGELVVRVTQSIQISKLCRLNFLKIEMQHSEVTYADVNKCYHTTDRMNNKIIIYALHSMNYALIFYVGLCRAEGA